MDWGIREIAGLVIVLMWAVSPVAPLMGLLALLNRRDGRQERLLALAASHFSGEALRGDIVIDARCALLTRRAVIRVEVCHGSREVWPAIERLRQTLPPMVGLMVTGSPRPDPMSAAQGGAASLETPAALGPSVALR
jgi:hypothetical protein